MAGIKQTALFENIQLQMRAAAVQAKTQGSWRALLTNMGWSKQGVKCRAFGTGQLAFAQFTVIQVVGCLPGEQCKAVSRTREFNKATDEIAFVVAFYYQQLFERNTFLNQGWRKRQSRWVEQYQACIRAALTKCFDNGGEQQPFATAGFMLKTALYEFAFGPATIEQDLVQILKARG